MIVYCEHCMNEQTLTPYEERLINSGYGVTCKICGNLIYKF